MAQKHSNGDHTKVAVLEEHLIHLQESMNELKVSFKMFTDSYMTRREFVEIFQPYKKITIGIVTACVAFVGYLIVHALLMK
jgi:hypothetical protein